jgi:hypothetical protein
MLQEAAQPAAEIATVLQKVGAGAFGAVVGWYVYYINRYRKDDVQLSDIVTLIGAVGGAAVLALFPAKTDLFGAYGIGLASGFFMYFFILVVLVTKAPGFTSAWFLDGRAPKISETQMIVENQRAMDLERRPDV